MRSISYYKSIHTTARGVVKSKKKKFILVAHGRSGSTLFFDLIKNHPQFTKSLHPKKSEVLSREVCMPNLWLEGFSERFDNDLFGVHIKVFEHLEKINKLDQNKQISFFNKMHSKGWKIIYLKRENILDIALSIMTAVKRGVWHQDKNDEPNFRNKFIFNKHELIRWVELCYLRQQVELRAISHVPFLPISYEQSLLDERNHQPIMDIVFEYLGVPSCNVNTSLKKTSLNKISDIVLNYNEIEAYLSSSIRFSKYIK